MAAAEITISGINVGDFDFNCDVASTFIDTFNSKTLNETFDNSDLNVLMYCCLNITNQKCRELVLRLIELDGININKTNRDGYNSFMLLCMSIHKDYDILEHFIANGADLTHTNNNGENVLHIVSKYTAPIQELPLTDLISVYTSTLSSIQTFDEIMKLEGSEMLIDQQDKDGNTPLITAVKGLYTRNTDAMIYIILNHNPNTAISNNSSKTALQYFMENQIESEYPELVNEDLKEMLSGVERSVLEDSVNELNLESAAIHEANQSTDEESLGESPIAGQVFLDSETGLEEDFNTDSQENPNIVDVLGADINSNSRENPTISGIEQTTNTETGLEDQFDSQDVIFGNDNSLELPDTDETHATHATFDSDTSLELPDTDESEETITVDSDEFVIEDNTGNEQDYFVVEDGFSSPILHEE